MNALTIFVACVSVIVGPDDGTFVKTVIRNISMLQSQVRSSVTHKFITDRVFNSFPVLAIIPYIICLFSVFLQSVLFLRT